LNKGKLAGVNSRRFGGKKPYQNPGLHSTPRESRGGQTEGGKLIKNPKIVQKLNHRNKKKEGREMDTQVAIFISRTHDAMKTRRRRPYKTKIEGEEFQKKKRGNATEIVVPT